MRLINLQIIMASTGWLLSGLDGFLYGLLAACATELILAYINAPTD